MLSDHGASIDTSRMGQTARSISEHCVRQTAYHGTLAGDRLRTYGNQRIMSRPHHFGIKLLILLLSALLAAGCKQAQDRPPGATTLPTRQSIRYVNDAGGFSLELPAEWDVQEVEETSLGAAVRLGLPPLDENVPGNMFYYAPLRDLDRDAALARLCGACTVLPEFTAATLNGQPVWQATVAPPGGESRVWTFVENGDMLVVFSLNSQANQEVVADILKSLHFSPIVKRAARVAEMAEAMRQTIAHQNGVEVVQVTVATIDEVTWADACLGVPLADELCAQRETAGYRVVLDAPAGRYTFHFEPVTTQIRLAEAPDIQIGAPWLEWRSLTVPCETVVIGAAGLAFGACGSDVLLGGSALSEPRAELMERLLVTLAPFAAETPAGFVEFFGRGSREATPAEQRQLAELAQLIQGEATGGAPGAGVVIAWQRTGGTAGYCDDLTILISGETQAHSCRVEEGRTPTTGLLDLEELVQLYTWIDLFTPGTLEITDEAMVTGMTVALTFNGSGLQSPADADLEPLLTLATAVFSRAAGVDDGYSLLEDDLPSSCPIAGAGAASTATPELGFCLLYPDRFSLYRPMPDEVVLAVDSLLNVGEPRATIEVLPAAGSTLEKWAADEAAAHGLVEGPEEVTVAGQPALVFDNLPGQDVSRVVLLVVGERLYRLTFVPIGEDDSDLAELTDALYQQVMASFTLLE
jgi:hypothetical protein